MLERRRFIALESQSQPKVFRANREVAMYVALRKLGYNTYHFLETSLNRANEHHKLWTEALNAKYYNRGKEFQGEDFDKMLWSYQVCAPRLTWD